MDTIKQGYKCFKCFIPVHLSAILYGEDTDINTGYVWLWGFIFYLLFGLRDDASVLCMHKSGYACEICGFHLCFEINLSTGCLRSVIFELFVLFRVVEC